MQTGPIQIQIEEKNSFPIGADLLLNRETIKDLGVSIGKNIVVSFGFRRAYARIGAHSASKSILLIHRSMTDRLLIPFNVTIQINYNPNKKELMLGPILGILISNNNLTLAEFNDTYGSFCMEAFEAAKQTNSLCYVTTLENMELKEGRTKGWILHNGKLVELSLPLPHVLYNRLSNRMKEKSGTDYELLQELKSTGVSIFNERFLDKWDVYQQLFQTSVHHYLPVTDKYKHPKALQEILKSFSVVYLKPTHGSEGKGIIRLHKTSIGYVLDQTTLNGFERSHYKKLSEMVKYLSSKLKKKSYLIQQGIPLVKWDGATVDFRVLLQKNRLGNWKIVSLISRLGNPQTFVSNLAQGGKLESAVKMIKQLKSSYSNIPSVNELKTAALEIATTLDTQLEGNYGEFGIDLGVDIGGRIWLIEVNSKPSKKNDAVTENVKGPRPSVLHLYEYVSYLSGFNASTLQPKNRR